MPHTEAQKHGNTEHQQSVANSIVTRRMLIRLVAVVILSVATGPTVSVLALELALLTSFRVAVPVWDHELLGAIIYLAPITAILALSSAVFVLTRRQVPKVLAHSSRAALFLLIATISTVFSLMPILNGMYDRYAPSVRHATTWAVGFSEDWFIGIQPGMNESEVVMQAGHPLNRDPRDGIVVWTYSHIGHYQERGEKGFHQRAVIFQSGRVTRIYRRYLTTEHIPF